MRKIFLLVALFALSSLSCREEVPTEMVGTTGQPVLAADGGECSACIVNSTFTRNVGTPVTEKISFEGDPAADYIIDLDDLGTEGADASVLLNGEILLAARLEDEEGPRHIRVAVNLLDQNELAIRLTGKPGSQLDVSLLAGAKVVGSDGATLREPGGAVTLEIPAGALDQPVEVVVRSWTPSSPVLDDGGPERFVELLPDDLDFELPVVLTLAPMDSGDRYGEDVFAFEGGGRILGWVPYDVDPSTGNLRAYLHHFSKYYEKGCTWLCDLPGLPMRQTPYTYLVTSVPGRSEVPDSFHQAAQRAFDQWGWYLADADIAFAPIQLGEPDFEIRAASADPQGQYCPDPNNTANCVDLHEYLCSDGDCAAGWAAWIIGEGGGVDRRVIILGYSDLLELTEAHRLFEDVVLHELGHHLGLTHYKADDCDSKPLDEQLKNADCKQPPVMANVDQEPLSVAQPLDCNDLQRLADRYYLISHIDDRCAVDVVPEVPDRGQLGVQFSPAPGIIVVDGNNDPVPYVTVQLTLTYPNFQNSRWVGRTDGNGRFRIGNAVPNDGAGTYRFRWETGIGNRQNHDLRYIQVDETPTVTREWVLCSTAWAGSGVQCGALRLTTRPRDDGGTYYTVGIQNLQGAYPLDNVNESLIIAAVFELGEEFRAQMPVEGYNWYVALKSRLVGGATIVGEHLYHWWARGANFPWSPPFVSVSGFSGSPLGGAVAGCNPSSASPSVIYDYEQTCDPYLNQAWVELDANTGSVAFSFTARDVKLARMTMGMTNGYAYFPNWTVISDREF